MLCGIILILEDGNRSIHKGMVCMTGKMDAQDLILNLKAAGFDTVQLKKFLFIREEGTLFQQLEMLASQREHLLECVHCFEQKIDCLDYLEYLIQQENGSV